MNILCVIWASQVARVVKNPPANAGDIKRGGFDPWVGKISWRRKWQLTPVFLPGKSQGQRSLAGYNAWSHKELDMTEHYAPNKRDPESSLTSSAI